MKSPIRLITMVHAMVAVLAVMTAGCGGSGGGSALPLADTSAECSPSDPSTTAECGTLILSLTDAEGDFSAYIVDVLSISLERIDGTRVDVLPEAVRVDFAQLTSLSELVGHTVVRPGIFTAGSIRIDYGDAEIFVESAGSIVPADLYDSKGTLLTTGVAGSVVEVAVDLPASDRLVVSRGRTAMLSIDFDLAASHLVDTSTDPVSAVAQPYLVAEVEPVDEKEMRVRGALVDVDIAAGTYDIRVRPWYLRDGDFGELTVQTDSETAFEIDAVAYTGSAGLEALARQPFGTLTVAHGSLDLTDRTFLADIVHAGDSVGGGQHAAVLGNVVSRSGDELVLRGALAIRPDRRSHFHRTIVVDVGPDTVVSRERPANREFDKDDLSVGQRVLVFGEFTNPAVDNTDPAALDIALMLDATNGRVRMLPTRLSGTLNSAVHGNIEMTLRRIDRLGVELFDFSGTGIIPDLDADPGAYEISTSTLPIDTLISDRPVRVIGYVTAFGEAPPDFEGHALIDPASLPAALGIGWGLDGTSAPFTSMSAASLVIDLSNPDIGERHHMLIGDSLIDLYTLAAVPAITDSNRPRVYGIWEPGHVELFKDFAPFVDELALRLSETSHARSLAAYGRYEEAQNSLAANKIVVHMLPAQTP